MDSETRKDDPAYAIEALRGWHDDGSVCHLETCTNRHVDNFGIFDIDDYSASTDHLSPWEQAALQGQAAIADGLASMIDHAVKVMGWYETFAMTDERDKLATIKRALEHLLR